MEPWPQKLFAAHYSWRWPSLKPLKRVLFSPAARLSFPPDGGGRQIFPPDGGERQICPKEKSLLAASTLHRVNTPQWRSQPVIPGCQQVVSWKAGNFNCPLFSSAFVGAILVLILLLCSSFKSPLMTCDVGSSLARLGARRSCWK